MSLFLTVQALAAFFVFAVGATVGSFINVVSLRFARPQSTLGGRSHCPDCGATLSWWELVPVLSFILLQARCRRCRSSISVQYPVVEAACGLLAVAIVGTGGFTLDALLHSAMAVVLVILFLIDLRTFILPDFYIVLLGVLAAVTHALSGNASPQSLLAGVVGGAGFLLLLWLATRARGIGLGDVKLAVVLGLMFGLPGTAAVLFLSFIVGGLIGLYLLLTKKATPKTALPFGPFLAGAALLFLVWPHFAQSFWRLLLLF